jgi:hypothetical protein
MPIVQDWTINIDFAWAQYDAMRVHHGFLGAIGLQPLFKRREANLAYFAVIALLNISLSQNLDVNPRIILTSNSLGDALTVLYVAMLRYGTKEGLGWVTKLNLIIKSLAIWKFVLLGS